MADKPISMFFYLGPPPVPRPESLKVWARSFEIFAKYPDPDREGAVVGETDEVLVNLDPKAVSDADRDELYRLGWSIDALGRFSKDAKLDPTGSGGVPEEVFDANGDGVDEDDDG